LNSMKCQEISIGPSKCTNQCITISIWIAWNVKKLVRVHLNAQLVWHPSGTEGVRSISKQTFMWPKNLCIPKYELPCSGIRVGRLLKFKSLLDHLPGMPQPPPPCWFEPDWHLHRAWNEASTALGWSTCTLYTSFQEVDCLFHVHQVGLECPSDDASTALLAPLLFKCFSLQSGDSAPDLSLTYVCLWLKHDYGDKAPIHFTLLWNNLLQSLYLAPTQQIEQR
jgi:hypothetical protein